MRRKLHWFRWNNLRLRNKLMILYIAAVLIPIVLTNTVFYSITAGNVRTEKMKDLKYSLERDKNNFRKMIEGIISFSSVIYNDALLYSALDQTYASENEVLSVYNDVLSSSIKRFIPLNKQFYNAYLYTDNDSLILSGMLQWISPQIRDQPWYQETTSSTHRRQWMIYTHPTDCVNITNKAALDSGSCATSYLSVIRELDFYKAYSNYRKILKIDILPQYLENTLFDRSSPGQIYLINPQGDIVYSSEEKSPMHFDASLHQGKSILSAAFEDVDYLQGWKVTGVYPKRVINQSLMDSGRFIVYLTLANLLLPSIIILLFSRSLNSRLGLLLSGIKRVKNQRFDVLRAEPATDEIGQLTEEFNRMTVQINDLIQDVYVAELDRRQAQFNAVQSQINPHYLFNTLDAIRMNCLIRGEEETASVIKLLGRGFRRSLSWDQDLIPLQEEMEFVTDYLDIQQFRFGHRLTYYLDIDDNVLDILIPKMSILPLAENACIHGIENSEQPGMITVTVTRSGGKIGIRVEDNGNGLKPEQRLLLLDNLEQSVHQGKHVGLKNVYDRLKWHFGSEFMFSISSDYGHGTTVEIQIPIAFSK